MSAKRKSQQRALVIALILSGILFTAFFGMRALHAFRKFDGRPSPPEKIETDVELIRDWMTVSFISKTYYVPEKFIFDALDISPQGNHDKSLKVLNQDYYPNMDGYVLGIIKEAILTHQVLPPPHPDLAPTIVSPPIAPIPQ